MPLLLSVALKYMCEKRNLGRALLQPGIRNDFGRLSRMKKKKGKDTGGGGSRAQGVKNARFFL